MCVAAAGVIVISCSEIRCDRDRLSRGGGGLKFRVIYYIFSREARQFLGGVTAWRDAGGKKEQ